jgi:hypothetical protein
MNKHYSDIKFNKDESKFQHSLDSDFGCIALWKSAKPYLNDIRKLLAEKFEVLLETEIEWSAKYFHSNAQRLYEAPIYLGINQDEIHSSHSNKIGENKFILFIVRDIKPHYTYAQSVSGKIEMSNINIVNVKYEIRDWISVDTGVKYGIHSTNNIHEFFLQAPLLLGVERFERLLNEETIIEPFIKKDLEGAEGWKNYHELFQILNLTTNYLVQRGFETLPDENPEMDIDFLTDNHQRLASAIGAKQNKNQLYKGEVLINNQEISLDLRYVGDKYYDVNWGKDMLQNKVLRNGVYTPREDDYFFSLLFHAKVQKQDVKEKYIAILEDLSQSLNFDWYKTEYLQDNQAIGKILRGYYQSQAYVYENPIDKGVYKNKEVINFLPTIKTYRITKSFKASLKSTAIKVIPKDLIAVIKKLVRK